jgi:hypothetical protein
MNVIDLQSKARPVAGRIEHDWFKNAHSGLRVFLRRRPKKPTQGRSLHMTKEQPRLTIDKRSPALWAVTFVNPPINVKSLQPAPLLSAVARPWL